MKEPLKDNLFYFKDSSDVIHAADSILSAVCEDSNNFDHQLKKSKSGELEPHFFF